MRLFFSSGGSLEFSSASAASRIFSASAASSEPVEVFAISSAIARSFGGLSILGRRRAHQSQRREHHRERDHARQHRRSLERLADLESELVAYIEPAEQRDRAPPQHREQRRAPRPSALERGRIRERRESHNLLIAFEQIVELRCRCQEVVVAPIRAKRHHEAGEHHDDTRANQSEAEHREAIGRHRVAVSRPGQLADRFEEQSERNCRECRRHRAQHHADCGQPRDARAGSADSLDRIFHRMKL